MAEILSITRRPFVAPPPPAPPELPEPARGGDPVGAALIYCLGAASGAVLALLIGWLS